MSVKLAKRLIEPDFWTCPHGHRQRPVEALTYGPEVADLNAKANFAPDPQQELALDLIFAIRPDGSPATFEFCIICCRQNMKTGLFKQTALGWLFVTEEPLIAWSAHEMSTTNEARLELHGMFENSPFLSKHLPADKNRGLYDANGKERIELKSGQRILFKARTINGARGLGVPKLILDEGFALKASMMGSLLPLMLAQENGQMLIGSSAGKEDSEVLFDVRERGRNHMSPMLTYLEWLSQREECRTKDGLVLPNCQHPKNAPQLGIDCALDREHLIRKANPTISTGRIKLETVRNLRQAMPPEEFQRECLGWWDDAEFVQVIPTGVWNNLFSQGPPDGTAPTAIGVDMSHDRVLAIAACWVNEDDGKSHVEVVQLDEYLDTLAAVEWLAENAGRRIPVVIDAASPAASMIPELIRRKVKVHQTTAQDMGKACGLFYGDAIAERMTHKDQPQLNQALRGASKRAIREAGSWGWDRKDPTKNIAALVAATLARYGAATAKKRTGAGRAPGRPRTSNRRAVVMS